MMEPIRVIGLARSCHLCECGVVFATEREFEGDSPCELVFRCNRHEVVGKATRYPMWQDEFLKNYKPEKEPRDSF